MCRELEVTLPATGDAIADGRARIEDFVLRSFGHPEGLLDDALLVGSELLTNAMRTGSRELGLRLVAHVDELRVGVHDDRPGRPRTLPSPGPTDASGRGLGVVARLGVEWGVDRDDPGKQVWVRLYVPPGADPHFNCVHALPG
jgi:anti-sigma regulatory factor (Ser/Thr protein kinase)